MKSLFSILFVFLAFSAFAQYEFKGQVVDEAGEPVVGATIQIKNADFGTITDQQGEFSFEAGQDTIVVKINALLYAGPVEKQFYASDFNVITLTDSALTIQPVFISDKYPVTQTTITKEDLESRNLGQDIPILLEQQPSVVATSDAGAGVGYTGIRVRGSDATRVNVTINGVPLNDSESQGVFWVNMPDFSSSTDKITLVRGAGSSTNGAGAFGASLHLQTDQISEQAYAEYNGSAGSFNTLKNNIQFGTGNLGSFSAGGRLSKITSDGFIDRASSDLESYFFQAANQFGEQGENPSQIKFITFKGQEETYQAWYGVRKDILEEDRTFNPYTYENQVDNYQQTHYQLHWDQEASDNLLYNVGLHYTKGEGYFEEFKEDDNLSDYGIAPFTVGGETITNSDLVRRRWLDNDFFGLVSSTTYYSANHELTIGGGWNKYLGDHFGEVIQGEFVPSEAIGENYYQNDAIKNDFNIYGKYTYDYETESGLLRPYVDLQFRNVNYEFVGLALDGSGNVQNLPQSVSHNFFNPKAGISFDFGQHQLYASFSRAQKEPNRNDYTDSPLSELPKAEKLNDYELGYQFSEGRNNITINGYYMDYTDQLALTGGVNDVGEYSRVNVPDSHRLGVELNGLLLFGAENQFSLSANAALSENKIDSFTENIDDYDEGGLQTVQHEDTDLALSPNFIAGGNFTYQPNQTFSASLISKYVGDQYLDNTSTESRSIDAYWIQNLNLSASLGQFVPQLKTVDVHLLVNNLLDEEYEANGYTFGYIAGGETIYENYYYPQAGRNFLAGLTIRFE